MRHRIVLLVAMAALVISALPAVAVERNEADGSGGQDVEAAQERATAESDGLDREALADELAAAAEGGVHIVQFQSPAVPAYTGEIDGLEATAPEDGPLEVGTDAVQAYRSYLAEEQSDGLATITAALDREVDAERTYDLAINGVAVELEPDEAATLALLDEVAFIEPQQILEPQTDAGPEHMNADAIWDGDYTGAPDDGVRGEGAVVGVLDTGMWPQNPSFAGEGPVDGYVHQWDDEYLGVCDPDDEDYDPDFACNDKLVGAWGMTPENTAFDSGNHGSHVGSTAAGNVVDVELGPEDNEQELEISGVAPHAHIVSYRVCDVGCPLDAIIDGVNQAIEDEVDVINYSIGGAVPSEDLWEAAENVAWLNANGSGIAVSHSAGNAGPGDATINRSSDLPWVTSVGASEHNRAIENQLTDIVADGDDQDDVVGKGFTGDLEAGTDVVYDTDNPYCYDPVDEDFADGNIVLCDRGGPDPIGRVEGSENVAAAGGAGFVLMNMDEQAASVHGDEFAVPGVHVSFEAGETLKDLVADNDDVTAGIDGYAFTDDNPFTDYNASFSSRGPNQAADTLVPNVTAPGLDIIAAINPVLDEEGVPIEGEPQWGVVSGTSMSSPHVAGAYGLLAAARDWSPAEAQSALQLTARSGMPKEDGSPGDPYSEGSGYADLSGAADAGFIMDITADDYWGADPDEGGDVRDLNFADLVNTECIAECSWTRTLTGTTDAEWDVSVEAPDGVNVTVEPGSISLSEGEEVELTVTADVRGVEFDELLGSVEFASDDAPDARMPMAVASVEAVVPDVVEFEAESPSGSDSYEAASLAMEELAAEHTGLAIAEQEILELPDDPTEGDPFDGSDGTWYTTLDVNDGQRLAAEVLNHEELDELGADIDLFIGAGDEPSEDTLMCVSAAAGNAEYCSVSELEAGTYWILFQNWQSSDPEDPDHTDTVEVAFGATTGEETNLEVTVPGSVVEGEWFDVVLEYNEPEMEVGDRLYAYVDLIGDGESIGATDVNYTVTDMEEPPPGDPVDLEVTPSAPTIGVGGAVQLEATAVYEDDSEVNVTDEADWASDDTDVATVDDAGLVTGVAEGTADVTATFEDLSDSATVTVDPEVEPGPVGLERISAEPGRVEVAIAASQHRFDDGEADAVVLARADEYPDALAGTTLAADHDAPLLLTSSDQLLDNVTDEISRVLGDDGSVYLTGGTEALDDTVEEAAGDLGYELTRLGGQTRFETAGVIAAALGERSQVLVTTGLDFPDALTAGAAASANDGVVLLSADDDAHDVVDDYLDGFDGDVTAVGGPATRAYPDAEPVMGETRDETAVAVAEAFFDQPVAFGVSRRDDYPDALSGGAHIAAYGGPLLLSYTEDVPEETAGWLQATDATGGFVYGGTHAISEDTFDELEDLAGFDNDDGE